MKRTIIFLVLTLILTACAATEPVQLIETTVPLSTATFTPLPPTATSTSEPRQTPTQTPTPTIAYPVQAATQFPATDVKLTKENIPLIQELATRGGPEVSDIQYSIDGKYLIVTTDQDEIHYFDTSTFEKVSGVDPNPIIPPTPPKYNNMPDGDFTITSPEGKYVATTNYSTINIYEMPDATLFKTYNYDYEFTEISFLSEGKILALHELGLIFWNFLDESASPEYLRGNSIKSYAMTPNGEWLALLGWRGSLIFHNLENIDRDGIPAFSVLAHDVQVKKVIASPDSKYFVTTTYDNKIKFWNAADGSLVHTIDFYLGILGWQGEMEFWKADSTLAVSYSDASIKIWDIERGTIVDPYFYDKFHGADEAVYYTGMNPLYDFSFSANFNRIAFAGHSYVSCWELATGEQIFKEENQTTIKSIALSPDGKTLAYSTGLVGTFFVIDLESNTQLWKGGGYVDKFIFSPDGAYLAVTPYIGQTASSIVYNAKNGEKVKTIQNSKYFAFSPNGENAVSISENKLSYWETDKWKLLFEIEYENFLQGFAFSPDGRTLVFNEIVGDPFTRKPGDYDLIFFDIENQKEIHRIPIIEVPDGMKYTFSPNGYYFIYGYGYSNTITVLGIPKN